MQRRVSGKRGYKPNEMLYVFHCSFFHDLWQRNVFMVSSYLTYSFSETDRLFMNFQINDQLKDFCRKYLKDREQKERNQMKRQIGSENFPLKKKMTAKNAKVIFI